MGCYEQNIEFIRQYDPLLYDNYLKWKQEKQNNDINISEGVAKDGNTYLVVERNGKMRRLNSSYSPENEAREWAMQFSLNNIKQTIFMLGLGNGKFLTSLENGCKADARFLIYEPSIEIFDYIMKNESLVRWFGKEYRYLVIQGLNEEKFYHLGGEILNWDNIDCMITTEHPGYKEMFPDEYRYFCTETRNSWMRAVVNRNTMAYFGEEITKNSLGMIPYLKDAHFYEQYIGKFEDAPVIIVSAGPSLNQNIELLNKAKGKAVILAVDTAMRELNKYKIVPDFVITVDPQKIVEYMAEEETKKVPLFCSDYSNRRILELHKGKKIFFDLHDYIDMLKPDALKEKCALGSGGSVATVAFSLCHLLGFKTIILIGQDLAYKDGASHAGNRVHNEETHGMHKMEVEDIYGNPITTRREWYQFLIWFNDAVNKVKDIIAVVDATEGGAKISGTKIMTLEEAIAHYCTTEIDCAKLIDEIPSAYQEGEFEEKLSVVRNTLESIDVIEKKAKEACSEFEELCRCCKRKEYGAKYRALIKKVTTLSEKIKEQEAYELINTWAADRAQSVLGDVNRMSDNLDDNELKVYQKSIEFYRELEKAAKEVKPILQDTYKRI